MGFEVCLSNLILSEYKHLEMMQTRFPSDSNFYDGVGFTIFFEITKFDFSQKIGGWEVLNQEIVPFRSCVRTRGLVA